MPDNKQIFGKLLRGAVFIAIDFVLTLAIGFWLAPYIRNTLGDRLNGIWVLASAFVGTFSLLDMGIDGAVSRYFAFHYSKGEKEECVRLSNTAFFLFLLLGFLGFACITLIAWGVVFFHPEMKDRTLYFQVMLLTGIVFGINFPTKAVNGVITGALRQDISSSRAVIFRLLGALLTFLALFYGGGVVSIALVNLFCGIIALITIYRLANVVFPEFSLNIKYFQKDLLPKLFQFGLSTFMVFLANVMRSHGNVFFLAAMVSVDSISLYSLVALSLSTHFFNVTDILCGTWIANWFTYLHANENHSLMEKSLAFSYKICTYISTFIAFGLIVWGHDFIAKWIGHDAVSIYPSLVILTIGVWFSQCQAPNIKYLFALAKHRFTGYVSIIGAIVGVVLTVVFLKLGWGVDGAAISSLIIALLTRGITIPYYVCRTRNINPLAYFARIFGYIAASLLACIIPFVLSHYLLAPTWPRLFLVGSLSTLTYWPVVCLVGFSKNERNEIQQQVFKRLWKSKNVA